MIIKPSKILYHIDGQHFGTFSETELNRVMKEIGTWEIQDVQNITHAVQEVGLADFLSQSGHAEIFFPDPFPLQLYKSFLKINDKEHSLISFDRFVIDVNSENREEGIVYFVSTGDNLVYEARINSRLTRDFKRSFYNTAKRYPEQIEYSLSETNSVYLPKDETVVNRLDYFTDTIDIKTFIDRLFTDPDLVKGIDSLQVRFIRMEQDFLGSLTIRSTLNLLIQRNEWKSIRYDRFNSDKYRFC